MVTSFQVVDDFCPEIDAVRASALASGFSTWTPPSAEVGSGKYEGMNFVGSHHFMLKALALATGGHVFPAKTFFRITTPGMEKAYIHSDRHAGAHTCVAYLSKHEDVESGTGFYRHKPTGLTYMPTVEECKERGIWEQLKEDMVNRTNFELTDFVRGAYNRALIFQAPLWHARHPLDGIGSTDEDARMVWVGHFHKMAPNGELV